MIGDQGYNIVGRDEQVNGAGSTGTSQGASRLPEALSAGSCGSHWLWTCARKCRVSEEYHVVRNKKKEGVGSYDGK